MDSRTSYYSDNQGSSSRENYRGSNYDEDQRGQRNSNFQSRRSDRYRNPDMD